MKYVGLQQQIKTNNRKSILLLLAFPFLVLAMVFLFFFIINYNEEGPPSLDLVLEQFINAIPMVFIAVGIWFAIAYFSKDRKSTRLNSSHVRISYAVFCLKKKITIYTIITH